MSEHAKTPVLPLRVQEWQEPQWMVVDADGAYIALSLHGNDKPNMEYIAHRANMHDELVGFVTDAADWFSPKETTGLTQDDMLELARALLKRCEEGK